MSPSDTLIRALQDERRYPHPVSEMRLIETHISWVILTGRYVYKVKKPVDLGFLDFTSLAARRHFCEEELRLNRRLAPALYLGVVAITGSPEDPHLEGPGEPFEYAVRMLQFADELRLDHLLAAGRLSPELVERLAHVIARFHAALPCAAAGDHGGIDSVRTPARENFTAIRLPAAFEAERRALKEVEAWTERRLVDLEPLVAQRKAAGFVRECHGDLHLANVTLHEGAPTPFDCLEFDPRLRWIDVMNEVAFLTMDLDFKDRGDLSLRFLNEYLHHTGDYEGLRVLRFYQAYRAMVRAKIEGIRIGQSGGSSAADYEDLLRRIRLARRYTRAGRGAVVIAHGLSGSGKTTLSRALLESCGLIRIRSDVERKRLAGYPPDARTRSPVGGGLYTRVAGERTYARLRELAAVIIGSGYSAFVDATFLQRSQRDDFRGLARELDVPFVILDFQAPEEVLAARIRGRQRGTDASEADVAVLTRQLATHEPLAADEIDACIAIDTTADPDPATIAARLRSRLDDTHADPAPAGPGSGRPDGI